MSNCSTRIRMRLLAMIILYLFFFSPAYFLTFKYLKYSYYSVGIIISVIFMLTGFFCKKNVKNIENIQNVIFLISSFYLVIIVSTYINGGTLTSILAQSFMSIGFNTSIVYFFKKGYLDTVIEAMIFSLEFYVIANYISVVLFPEGLYTVYGYVGNYSNPAYILGHRNNAIEYCIPLIGLVELNLINKGKNFSINKICVRVISLITIVQTWSVNALLCMVFVILCDLYIKFNRKSKILEIINLFKGAVIISIMLVFFNVQLYFSNFLNNILKRNVTLSSRTKIWMRAISHIKDSPFIGYGVESAEAKYYKIGHPNSCHNYFLDYMYYGGVILLIIVFLLVYILNRQIKDLNNYVKLRVTIIFGAYFILWIATPIHRDYMFIMFGMMVVAMCFSNTNGSLKLKDNRGVI